MVAKVLQELEKNGEWLLMGTGFLLVVMKISKLDYGDGCTTP